MPCMRFAAFRGDTWILTASLTDQTFNFLGHDFLNGFLVVTSGSLSPVNGYGLFTVTVPSSTTIGLKLWTQVVTLNPILGLRGNTNVKSTIVIR